MKIPALLSGAPIAAVLLTMGAAHLLRLDAAERGVVVPLVAGASLFVACLVGLFAWLFRDNSRPCPPLCEQCNEHPPVQPPYAGVYLCAGCANDMSAAP